MDFIIIGGGISGLVAARELLKNRHSVKIFESGTVLGGLASSFKIKNKFIPKTYHHLLYNEFVMLDLISELNLQKNIVWNDSHLCFWYDNKAYKLTKPQDILKFKPLSITARLKMIRLGAISLFKKDWSDLKTTDAYSWARKVVGKEVTENLFKPLAKIKFGELSSVSAAWFGERLHEAAINREKYAYLKGGLQQFIDSIGEDVKRRGGEVHLNSPVTSIKQSEVEVVMNGRKKSFKADKIISSLPPPALADIAYLPKGKKQILKKIKYKSLVCMVIGSKSVITPYYWNVFIKPKMKFGGLFHHTALYPQGGINGEKLYYLFTYLDDTDPFFKESDSKILEVYLKDIKKINPNFEFSWMKIFKIKYSSPIYTMDYENIPIKLTDSLYLTGIYRKYPSTRTMNTAAKSGLETANYILRENNQETFINDK